MFTFISFQMKIDKYVTFQYVFAVKIIITLIIYLERNKLLNYTHRKWGSF